MLCYCGSQKEFAECCQPYLEEKALPPTPEALLRSRYTAHVLGKTEYLRTTLAPETRPQFNSEEVAEWSRSEWLGLKVLSVKGNTIEFIATYRSEGKKYDHHEYSKFRRIGEKWYFVRGESHVHEEGQPHHHHHHEVRTPIVRSTPKIGRNDPCPCGSGLKYKKCCGNAA